MILVLVDDLMVGVRIQDAAKAIGLDTELVSTSDEAKRLLRSAQAQGLVVDLAISGTDLEELVAASRDAAVWLLAFYPHVDVGLRRAAQGAGIEYVYPRSRFLSDLPNILRERLDK